MHAINQSEYAQRRAALLCALPDNSIALVRANAECVRNAGVHYPYRQNSHFYYVTGFSEPDALAVFIPKRPEGEFILFCQTQDPQGLQWQGPVIGQAGACKIYGADQAFPISTLDEKIPELLSDRQVLYYPLGEDAHLDAKVRAWYMRAKKQALSPLGAIWDITGLLSEMRLYKTPFEIAQIKKACHVSAKAHYAAMSICRAGLYEHHLDAEIQHILIQNRCTPAYPNIIGSGKNACILHYNANDAQLKAGEMVLIDAGAEYQCYASDITRTFPVNGRFNKTQRDLYEAVLRVQLAVIDQVKPGVCWDALQATSDRLISSELLRLGILKGTLETIMKTQAFKRFYMHKIGHWMGLDVHDVGGYKEPICPKRWRVLAPNMVLTIEPGIYIPEDAKDIDPKWRGIGVRIEDDVQVTQTGCDILSAQIPKTVAQIEGVMHGAHAHKLGQ